ncbi:MAG: 16S rRNA (uracil(1498)-N(3))-methyltransferase [Myxococcota bacterium]
MNCLLIETEEFASEEQGAGSAAGRVRIEGRRRKHAEEILGARVGDTLRVGLVDGRMGEGEIRKLDPDVLEIDVVLDELPPPKHALRLILALPRPPVFKRVITTLASLGVEEVMVVGTARTEKSFWQSHVVTPEAIRDRLLLGLEQARDTVLPKVTMHRYFEPLVEEVLPTAIEGRRALLAHPSAEVLCPHAPDGPLTLFVGPEGGFVDYEVERLCSIGFEKVGLGPRILRVEPVIPLLIGRLLA